VHVKLTFFKHTLCNNNVVTCHLFLCLLVNVCLIVFHDDNVDISIGMLFFLGSAVNDVTKMRYNFDFNVKIIQIGRYYCQNYCTNKSRRVFGKRLIIVIIVIMIILITIIMERHHQSTKNIL